MRRLRAQLALVPVLVALLAALLTVTAAAAPVELSEAGDRAEAYLDEVVMMLQTHHPVGKTLERPAFMAGAKRGLINALTAGETLSPRDKAAMLRFLRSRDFKSVHQLVAVLDRAAELTPLEVPALADVAAAGMISATADPFSRLLTQPQLQELQQRMTQTTDPSIGIMPRPVPTPPGEPRRLKVAIVQRQRLAFYLGIREGDEIMAINGKRIADTPAPGLQSLFEAQPGEPVRITVRRDGIDAELTFEGVQGEIAIPAARGHLLPGGVGYVDTSMFTLTFADELKAEIATLKARGMKALIVDLRNNPGGALPACLDACDALLPQGQVITTVDSTYTNPLLEGPLGQILKPLLRALGLPLIDGEKVDDDTVLHRSNAEPVYAGPTAILVNGSSASASEMMSGALQTNGRAKVIGTTTYGKGVGQTIVPLDASPEPSDANPFQRMLMQDPSMRFLYLTVMTYFRPDGAEVQGIGITPDIEVDRAPAPADIAAILKGRAILAGYVEAHLADDDLLVARLLNGAPIAIEEMPGADELAVSIAKSRLPRATALREIRGLLAWQTAQRNNGYSVNVPDDRQLQRAIVTVLGEAGVDAGEIPEYEAFAAEAGK
jgi:carboxyl-terminal processing protease